MMCSASRTVCASLSGTPSSRPNAVTAVPISSKRSRMNAGHTVARERHAEFAEGRIGEREPPRGAQRLVVRVVPGEGRASLGAAQPGILRARERREHLRRPHARRLFPPVAAETVHAVLAHRLEHAIAPVGADEPGAVDKQIERRGIRVERVGGGVGRPDAVGEDGCRQQRGALGVAERLPAPRAGSGDADRRHAAARQQREAVVETRVDLGEGEGAGLRRGELERERQAVQTTDDPIHRRRLVVAGRAAPRRADAPGEQLDGVGQGERPRRGRRRRARDPRDRRTR